MTEKEIEQAKVRIRAAIATAYQFDDCPSPELIETLIIDYLFGPLKDKTT